MDELTWTDVDVRDRNQSLAEDQRPKRFAITTVIAALRNRQPPALLLCNPHPETWNNWLLPYCSDTGTDDAIADCSLVGELTARLHELEQRRPSRGVQAIVSELETTYGISQLSVRETALFRNYSLKYSKTSSTWTAYSFNYWLCTAEPPSGSVQFTWLLLNDASINATLSAKTVNGLKVADNVLALLTCPARDRMRKERVV